MNIFTSLKRQIPNLITLGNLTCGVVACYMASQGFLWQAAVYIIAGIFLDFFDGLAARLLGVASPVGKELDSLADVVTSGVAPALILFKTIPTNPTWLYILSLAAFLMPAFAAYRLAKFNLDTRQSHSFLGLPAPSNALIWVGLALLSNNSTYPPYPLLDNYFYFYVALIVLSLITDILMVSELPMFSLKFNFKDLSWKTNRIQYIFLIGCALIIGITRQWYAISILILWYILLSLLTQRKHPAND
ncbi:MAG: CDP-diacylglycerol--serine O-phosphatidyltransferase [Bacteroidales bacterium]|nr:CDP-diacylglycerol--serine O-phosphatidyltransferase [Bacteroidales bacterium]